MAYVELGQDNGGILLNLGEGGFAVQSALALTTREFPELRFQVPALQGWLTASGRIAWISDSKKEAGIQFTELPPEARSEIQKWVLAEGDPEKTKERIPVTAGHVAAARIAPEPGQARSGMFDRPYSSEDIHQQAVGQTTRPSAERAEQRQAEQVGVAVAEAPQDFHFTDYSMFAAAPEKEAAWAQPAPRSGGWRGAMLAVLLAALCFALGATVGRETVNRWVINLGDWTSGRSTTALKVTPPPAPEKLEAREDSKSEGSKTAKEGAEEQPSPGDAGASSAAGSSPEGERRSAEFEPKPGTPEASKPNGSSPGDAGTTGPAAGSARASKRSVDTIPRESRYAPAESSGVAAGASILVNAPEPGSPPFYVNLPTEAVSASGAIAISARRTLEVLPRSVGSSGAERVVVGKLIAHSEPFYPADARSRGIEGSVQLRARIGRTGRVVGVTPVSGPLLLFPAAVAAVREWRYEPTFVNGDPAETLADITVVFRLH